MATLLDAPTNDDALAAWGLLGAGLVSGNMGHGLLAANNYLSEAPVKRLQMQQAQQGIQKGGIELKLLQDQVDRQNRIRNGLVNLETGNAQVAPTPAAPTFTTPSVGGVPFFSQGTKMDAPAPPSAAAPAASADGAPGGGFGASLSQRLIRQAQVYAQEGDFEGANKLYEHAAKFMPEVNKIEVAMDKGQPVNVITFKDGTQQVSRFSPKADVHWMDTGSQIVPINQLTMKPMTSPVAKTMTPDASASNSVAWANFRNASDRLSFDKSQAGKPQFHEGAWYTPPSAQNPMGSVVQPPTVPGQMPKLTEFQGKSTTFSARMQDASKVLNELGDKVAPSQVAQAGYRAELPAWLPGGQVVGGALTAANNQFNPMVSTNAQLYRQAQENWVTANLRQESGAAIGKEEMEKDIRKWFPQPGDSKALIAQKSSSRGVAERAMLTQAGPGAALVPNILQPGTPPQRKPAAPQGTLGSGTALDKTDPLGIRQ